MKQTRNPKYKKLVFVWNKTPENIYAEIIDRMEQLGFPSFREYVRYLVHTDLKKAKNEMYG